MAASKRKRARRPSMKKGKSKKPQIGFKAPEAMRAFVVQLAEKTNVNLSDVVREAAEVFKGLYETLEAAEWHEAKRRSAVEQRPMGVVLAGLVRAALEAEHKGKG